MLDTHFFYEEKGKKNQSSETVRKINEEEEKAGGRNGKYFKTKPDVASHVWKPFWGVSLSCNVAVDKSEGAGDGDRGLQREHKT